MVVRAGIQVFQALAWGAGVLACQWAMAQEVPVPSRGALLYDTHCRACHDEQVHWRDRRAARDWPGLKAEVARWQAAARLGWTEADILAVARHLNETVYHLPQTEDLAVGRPPAGPVPAVRAARWGSGGGDRSAAAP